MSHFGGWDTACPNPPFDEHYNGDDDDGDGDDDEDDDLTN